MLAGDRMGAPLGAEDVRFIVKARCAAAGLEGRFSVHSLRSGFVTEAGLRDMPMTGHRTVATFQGYYQSGLEVGYAAREAREARLWNTERAAGCGKAAPFRHLGKEHHVVEILIRFSLYQRMYESRAWVNWSMLVARQSRR